MIRWNSLKYLLLVLLGLFQEALAQNIGELGSPIIKNYDWADYKASTQNWAVVQGLDGIMYFGNNNGALVFDGKSWELIPVKNSSCVRSLERDDTGKIFVGAIGDFGFLKPDINGKLQYESLLPKLDSSHRNFNDVWDVFAIKSGVYFFTDNLIFLYEKDTVRRIYESKSYFFPYKVQQSIFLLNNKVYILNGEKLLPIPHTNLKNYQGNPLILEYDDSKVLCINNIDCFTIDVSLLSLKDTLANEKIKKEQIIEKIPLDFDVLLKENRIYCGARLDDKNYTLGVIPGGIIVFNKIGKIQQLINKNRGLKNNTVLKILPDLQKNLWVCLDNGISYIEINNPITVFNESNNLEGSIYSTIRHNNSLYSSTNVGAFVLKKKGLKSKNDNTEFLHLPGNAFSCWDFIEYKGSLYCSTSSGLARVEKEKIVPFFRSQVIYTIEELKFLPGTFLLGMGNGLGIIKDIDKPVSQFRQIKTIDKEVRGIAEDDDGNIIVGTSYDGVYKLKFSDFTLSDLKCELIDTSYGIPKMNDNFPFFINGQFLVASTKGVLKADPFNDKQKIRFSPDQSFGNCFNTKTIDFIFYDADDYRYIINTSDGVFIVRKGENEPAIDSTSFGKIRSVNNILLEADNTIWFSTANGLYRSKLGKEMIFPKVEALLTRITINKDSVIFYNKVLQTRDRLEENTIEFSKNSIHFMFSLPVYEQGDENFYSFYLEGFDETWGAWTKLNEKEYINLPEGHYVFHVKARDFYGNISTENTYTFKILAPWFRTWTAYLFYFSFLGMLVYLVVIFNLRRLKRANLRLEEIIKARTAEIKNQNESILNQNKEINRQKEEILIQSNELERTNHELEKLSLVASETDNAVMILDPNGYFEWVNSGFTRIYGYSFAELMDKGFLKLTDINIQPIVSDNFKRAIHTKRSVRYESFIESVDRNLWIQTTLTPISNSNDEIIKLVAIDSDISQIKLAEEEISMQKEELLAQSEQLEEANSELERKNQYITDSISYAKRIQVAMLPSMEVIKKHFNEFFIYYLPKDIVSGDFYWFSEQEDYLFVAAIDCTGHGVPGAFMSMIGNTLLNSIVNEQKVFVPSKILYHLNAGIIKALNYETDLDDSQDDGMDISICRINKNSNEITIAAANHNVFIIANNELQMIEGEYHSIGGSDMDVSETYFPDHQVKFSSQAVVYLLTDGLQDQFGGPDNKKFMLSQFKKFIFENSHQDLLFQYEKLKEIFEKWKGYNKQIDDVLVMGLKINNRQSQ